MHLKDQIMEIGHHGVNATSLAVRGLEQGVDNRGGNV